MGKITSPIEEFLLELHRTVKANTAGRVADYIPELAKADPNWIGISIVTADGHVYEVGDSRQTFTIQSISKPFVYGLALEDQTRKEMLRKVGVEPTGEAFNSISLHPVTGQPMNPMINAGAIATTGMVQGSSDEQKFERILEMFELYVGRKLTVDESVYQSESLTGHRNRAIGFMLRNFDILESDPTPVLENYFRQCSISVSCRDLAIMGATLANAGCNPVTGNRAVRGEYVESILSVMGSCGMYDYAGEWIYTVGMPAKSGVAGGIVAVLPGQLGIGVFSPRLDEHGNSVRGIQVCNALSMEFNLHLFNVVQSPKAVIRLEYNGSEVASNRQRSLTEAETLREHGRSIRVYELQGELVFATAEVVVRRLTTAGEELRFAVIDLKRVLRMDEAACRLLTEVTGNLRSAGCVVVFAHAEQHRQFRRFVRRQDGSDGDGWIFFEDTNRALEYCENVILRDFSCGDEVVPFGDVEVFAGMSPEDVSFVEELTVEETFHACDVVVRMGDHADALYFLTRGDVSVQIPLENGDEKRLASFSAGMVFGEMAFIDGAPRSAMVYADSDVTVRLLKREAFDRLGVTRPEIKIRLLENLLRVFSRNLRKANREIYFLNQ